MKYSKAFERDFKWYLQIRNTFDFDGKPSKQIVYDKNGVSGKEAFYIWDSTGKLLPTKHPNILQSLIKTKGSVNLHIKMYGQDRANGLLSLHELKTICKEYNCPDWFFNAVEATKVANWPSK